MADPATTTGRTRHSHNQPPSFGHMSTPAGLPDCEAVVRALWDYLDRQLSEADLAAIDAHLAVCEKCRAHAEFERRLIDEIRAVRAQQDEPDALRARVLAALRRARLTGERR
jgi:anti-sigma factor (TIGR02949 family)